MLPQKSPALGRKTPIGKCIETSKSSENPEQIEIDLLTGAKEVQHPEHLKLLNRQEIDLLTIAKEVQHREKHSCTLQRPRNLRQGKKSI